MVTLCALAAARLIYAATVTKGAGVLYDLGDITPLRYFLTQGRAVWLYIRLVFFPVDLNFDRDFPLSHGPDVLTLAAWTALLVLLVTAAVRVRKEPIWFWVLGAMVLLLPTSSFLPLGDLVAERRIYLPLISGALAIGVLIAKAPRPVGIVILLDRSIKPGDTISLGETFGWTRELRARFVSVVTRDGREYLIPNEDFITHEVINWSFSDDLVRLDVPFGVAYSSDPHEVTKLAIEAAKSVRRVVDLKEPVCWLTEFGDSSLNFLLRFWISDPQNGLTNVRGTVLLAVWDKFKEHDVNIPFPHREVIMRTPVEIKPLPEPE